MNFSESGLYRLYAVTDGDRTKEAELIAALQGGVTLVQLREKNLSDTEFLAKAKLFVRRCHEFDVPLIVNDRLDIALEAGADGVHLGQSDGSLVRARTLAPQAMIGASVHTLEEAKIAVEAGVDYLGVGAVFPTQTKSDARYVPPAMLGQIVRSVEIPVVAIGGISLTNIDQLAGIGIAGVAVVSAIFSQPDISEAARQFKERVDRLLAFG